MAVEERNEGRLPFRGDVEGLRGVAVLLVVAFHVGIRSVSGGFVGVDVFFVISGYLITALLRDELRRTGTISLPAFFARRMRRLIPAAAVVLVATMLLSAIVSPPLEIVRTAESARAAAAYVSNVHFLRLASDYFSGDAASSPVVHTWSLSVEEQFYVMWPLVFLVLARAGGRGLGWTLTAIGVLSFAAAAFYVTANHSLAFYAMPLRAWEFACGGLASMVANRRSLPATVNYALGWTGLALVVCAATLYSAATEFPGVSALIPVVGTAMVLIAGALPARDSRWRVGAVLGASPMQWIGRRSYGWYLWHWPVIVLGASLMPSATSSIRIALGAFALVLAALTYRFIETPLRTPAGERTESKRDWRTIRLGLAATLIVIVAAELARRQAAAASRSPAQRAFTAAATDIADPYHHGCVNVENDDRVRVCAYGAADAKTTIALFGDSHAAQWFPALEAIAREHQWGLLLVAKTRCATAQVPVYPPGSHTESLACRRWRDAAIDTIRRRRPTMVVLANAMLYVRGPRVSPDFPAVSPEMWTAGMIATLAAFHASKTPAIVLQGTPLLIANAPACLARSGWLGRRTDSCATDRRSAFNAAVAGAEQHAIAAVPGNRLVDLTDALCGPTMCSPVVRGIIAYSDNEHLTASMARSLAPALDSAFGDLKVGTWSDGVPEPATATPLRIR